MSTQRTTSIKRAQKESVYLRHVSNLFLQAQQDHPELQGLQLTRVALSRDGGIVYVYFYTPEGEAEFEKKLAALILFKPSLRAAVAREVRSRYTPDFKFRYDKQFEKTQAVENLLERLKQEGKL